MNELSRCYDPRHLPGEAVEITATAEECAALAERFGLVRIDRLTARIALERDGEGARAAGTLDAAVVQSCAVSGEDLFATIAEPLALHFVSARDPATLDDEIELTAAELDEIEFTGSQFDLGEAIAQTLALAIDPYAVGPNAEEARRSAGLLDKENSGPFAALAVLKTDPKQR